MEPYRRAAWLNVLSFAWLGVACSLIVAAPELAGTPELLRRVVNGFAFTGTGFLIVANLADAWHAQSRAKRLAAALPRTLLALVLFVVLFAQVAYHLGMEHFSVAAAPGPKDWLAFGGAHLLRAADLLDCVDQFDIPIQAIHHQSVLSSALLVAFHLVAGLVVLDLFWKLVMRLKKSLVGSVEWNIVRSITAILGSIVFVFAIAGAISTTILRVFGYVDGDSVPTSAIFFMVLLALVSAGVVIAGNRFADRRRGADDHSVLGLGEDAKKPLAGVAVTVGVAVGIPLLIAMFVVSYNAISDGLRCYGPDAFGLWVLDNVLRVVDFADVMVIFDLRTHQVAGFYAEQAFAIELRILTALALGWLLGRITRRTEVPAEGHVWDRRGARGILTGSLLGAIALTAPFFLVPHWGDWDHAARHWAAEAGDPDHRERALVALRAMGPHAAVALPALQELATTSPPSEPNSLMDTMSHLGPTVAASLEVLTNHSHAPTAAAAFDGLSRIRPPAVAAVARSATRHRPNLDGWPRRSVRALVGELSFENAGNLVPELDRLEPLWFVPEPRMSGSKEVRNLRVTIELIRHPEMSPDKFMPPARIPPSRWDWFESHVPSATTAGPAAKCLDVLEPAWREKVGNR